MVKPSSFVTKTKISQPNSSFAKPSFKRSYFVELNKEKKYPAALLENLEHQAHDPKDPHHNPHSGEVQSLTINQHKNIRN